MTNPMSSTGPVLHAKSGDNDFLNLVAQSLEDAWKALESENADLRQCLKMLQDEMLEIVKIKSEYFDKRYRIEFGKAPEKAFTRDHGVEAMSDGQLNLPFDRSGKMLIEWFQNNIQ